MLWRKIKHFFGFFNLTPFEVELIDLLRKNLSPKWATVLDSQFNRFNQTERIVEPADELWFGHTSFYSSRFGKSDKFPMNEECEDLATIEVYSPEDDNLIEVTFTLVTGSLFTIKYKSKKYKFVPLPGYELRNFQLLKGEFA